MSTDNANLASKLALRRSFLRQLPAVRPRVFDACQGSGVIWQELRKEFDVRYWGVDVKQKRGRIKIDSARVLETSGWTFDVVDIDTYGQPWRHWAAVLRHGTGTVTVFLTIGEASGLKAPLSNDGLLAMGLSKLADVMPYGLKHQLTESAVDSLLAMSYANGWTLERIAESTPGPMARYLGVRMTRKAKAEAVPKSVRATGL